MNAWIILVAFEYLCRHLSDLRLGLFSFFYSFTYSSRTHEAYIYLEVGGSPSLQQSTMLDNYEKKLTFPIKRQAVEKMDLRKRLNENEPTIENTIVVNTITKSTLKLWDITEIVDLYHTYNLCHITKLII